MTICTINASLARALSEENSGVKALFKEEWAKIQESITESAREGKFSTTFFAPSWSSMTKVQYRAYRKIIEELKKSGFEPDEYSNDKEGRLTVAIFW